MKIATIPILVILMIMISCESTEDILEQLDHEVPEVEFMSDTLEVDAGSTITVEAVVSDESGIERVEFSYANWRINIIEDLSEEPVTQEIEFLAEIAVPEDALKEWEEDKYFNDASSIRIIQQYHPLEMRVLDKNRNETRAHLYVKVK